MGKDGDKAGEEEKKRGVRTHGEKGIYVRMIIEHLWYFVRKVEKVNNQ